MVGTHLLIDLYGIDPGSLDDTGLLEACLRDGAGACGLTPVCGPKMHAFEGGGVTGVILLSESHIALHSYPEHGFLAVDVFSCGPGDAERALDVFKAALNPERVVVTRAGRGMDIPG